MSLAYVQSAKSSSGSPTVVSLNGVGAGALIVLHIKWEGVTTGDASASDGTSSLAIGTRADHSNNDFHQQFGYLLVANSGNKTYTVTFPSGAAYQGLIIWEFSYSGTVSLDTSAWGLGSGTAPSSGAITTTGTDEVVIGAYAKYFGNTPSAWKINSLTATASVIGYEGSSSWYKLFTSTFAGGDATLTLNASGVWICSVIAFKATAAGGLSIQMARPYTQAVNRAGTY